MRIQIILQGVGGEFVIGTMPKKTAKYWEDRGMEDLEDHLNERLDLEDVPEEYALPSWYDIDNIKHGNSVFMDDHPTLYIKNKETNHELGMVTLSEKFLTDKVTHDESMETDNLLRKINKEDCLFFAQSIEKGTWIFDDFEIDGEFAQEKLSFTTTECDGAIYLSTINFSGKEVANNLSVVDGNTRGVSFNFFFQYQS